MLHEKLLRNGYQLTNHMSGATTVRKDKKMLFNDQRGNNNITNALQSEPSIWLTPTLEEFSLKIKKHQMRNTYHRRFNEIIKSKTIPEKMDYFENMTADFYWMIDGLENLKKAMIAIPSVLEQYIRNHNTLITQEGIGIKDNLQALKNIQDELNNDVGFKSIIDELDNKKLFLIDARATFDETVKDFKKNSIGPVNKNIVTNPIFGKLNNMLDELVIRSPEVIDASKPLADLKFLDDYISRINEITLSSFKKVRECGMTYSMADTFYDKLTNVETPKSITAFIRQKEKYDFSNSVMTYMDASAGEEKTYGDDIEYTELAMEGNIYKSLLFFKDDSMLIQKKSGEYVEVYNNEQVSKMRTELINEMIKDTFKKNPQIAKGLILIASDVDDISFSTFQSVINTYKENMDILKLYNVDIINTYKEIKQKENSYRNLEKLDDLLNKTVRTHKIKQYAESISSGKYQHLYSEEAYKVIENIYDLSLKRNDFQNNIGRKMAAYKTPEDFVEALKMYYRSFSDFTAEATINKAENAGAEVLVGDDDLVILKIKDFEESKLLGSGSWCISRDASYFKSYAGDGQDQYFIFDYSKQASDSKSMIGITLNNEEYYTAHFKNDDHAEENDISEFIDIINEAENKLFYRKENKLKNTL